MQGALKITYLDGNVEYFEVEPVGGQADMATRLKSFLSLPQDLAVPSGGFEIFPVSAQIFPQSLNELKLLLFRELQNLVLDRHELSILTA